MASQGFVTTDEVLQFVLKNFITLDEDERKLFVRHYSTVLDKLVQLMKENDKLFSAIFQRLYFAGSFYDGLKVGKPEEFDIDVVMKLPVSEKTIEFIRKKVDPPFITVKIPAMENLKHHPEWATYRPMDSWTDKDSFLLQNSFRAWMESVVTKTLNTLPSAGNAKKLEANGQLYLISFKKTGPAMTFNITIPGGSKVDVDFVPVIEFSSWPSPPVRPNPCSKKDKWFIVPKPNSKNKDQFNERFWRLAFHDQERDLINGKNRLKPVCCLLKKLRDNNTALKVIASYYIKTLFLWDTLERKNDVSYYSRTSLTTYFVTMLKMLRDHLKQGQIKYYWDDRYDLLYGIAEPTKNNCVGRLDKIIKDIETKSRDDPKIIAKYLLSQEEFAKVEAYKGENRRSPPSVSPGTNQQAAIITNQMANVSLTREPESEPVEASLEGIVELLKSLQQQLIEQRKLTQTVIGKMCVLQNSVDQLTDDNTTLRDEIKLLRQCSKESAINNVPQFDHPPLVDLISTVDQLADSASIRDELKLKKERSKDAVTNGVTDELEYHSLVDVWESRDECCSVLPLLN